jgi:hypothetical protein
MVLLVLIAVSVASDDARACSCVGPHFVFLSPMGADSAPVNVHVRLEAPSNAQGAQTFVVRAHGSATAVTVQTRTYAEPSVTIVELVPSASLPALTRFEVATVDPTAHPPTTVIGTFKTGSTADTTAPRFDSIGKQRTRLNTHFGGGDCSIQGPWIALSDLVAHDDRPDGQLAYAVWAADATGTLNTTRGPDTLVFPYNNAISIGQTSLCDPRRFTFRGSVVTLAVAAVDESGNTSRSIRIRADLTHDTP